MERTIDIVHNPEKLNLWVRRSIAIFNETAYLDAIKGIYPFQISEQPKINEDIRREIIKAHNSRDTKKLLNLLKTQTKFPYEDPMWYLLKNAKDCFEKNPNQIQRIANILYSQTAEETLFRLESPPKLNTQTGPMFGAWLRKIFDFLPPEKFLSSKKGVFILDSSEEEGKQFLQKRLKQNVEKRPDLVAKINGQYIMGEAKWIGQPGGNQEKQVKEVLKFCKSQRGDVRRIGIVDGFPWAIYNANGKLINNKEAILIQESPYDILSTLLLKKYFQQFLSSK